MLGRLAALVALPMAGLLAQAPIEVRVSSPNDAAFVIRMPSDSAHSTSDTLVARGSLQLLARGKVTIASVDSVGLVHVEALENGRLIASGIGRYIIVGRDTSKTILEARAKPPQPGERKP
jgi:hypothetical protein